MVPLGEDMTLLHWGRHGCSGIANSNRTVQQPAVPLHLGRNRMKDPAGYGLTGLNTVTHLQYQTSTTRGFVQPSQNNSTSWGPDVQQQDQLYVQAGKEMILLALTGTPKYVRDSLPTVTIAPVLHRERTKMWAWEWGRQELCIAIPVRWGFGQFCSVGSCAFRT